MSEKPVGVSGRVAYMTEPGKMEIREYPLPTEIEPGALLLQVLQTNVCGSDIHVFGGHHPLLKQGGLGHEMVGKIVGLGAKVTSDSAGTPVREGDRIVPVYTAVCHACENCDRGVFNHCDHGFDYFGRSDIAPYFHGATFSTHYYLHPNQPFYRVPDAVPNAAAAGANCALSQVLHGLDRADVTVGHVVAIQGAGGLGLFATAVAKERGARVLVMDRIESRLENARRFGADEVINVDQMPTLNDRVEAIQQFAGTQGADVVVEVTGIPDVFAEGISYLRPAGKFVVMGTISPGQTTAFDPGLMVRKSAQILAINRYPPHYLRDSLEFLERFGDKYPFAELSSRNFTLDEAETALELSAKREIQRAAIVPVDG